MALSDVELGILRVIQANKEAFAEGYSVAAKVAISPDHCERICDDLADKGYLEAIAGRKKYKLGKEAGKIL